MPDIDHDFRTPLSRVRGLGSAKDGTEHFWRQRLSAIANVPLMIFFVWLVMQLWGADYSQSVALLSQPIIAIAMLLLLGSAIYHMKLGMQVVIEDYVHGGAGKALLILNTFFSIAIFALCAFSVLKLGFSVAVPVVPISQ